MQKRITGTRERPASGPPWLALQDLADVEVTSEDEVAPIEGAFAPDGGSGWRAGTAGLQVVRLSFHAPQRVTRIALEFEEHVVSRTQEFVLRWRAAGADADTELVRQQYTFAPPGTCKEREEYRVDLADAIALELAIIPHIGGGEAKATLHLLRVA